MGSTDIDRRAVLTGLIGLAGFTGAGVLSGCAGGSRGPGGAGDDTGRGGGASGVRAFPTVATASLNARQRAVIDVLRGEYASQPTSSKYTPDPDEPWCADFVSWVERTAGRPLRNPNSGGWRIPGTMTLLDHLRETRSWHGAGSGYVPVLGDIAIYDGDGPYGQHTNYVLSLGGDTLTTIGGNEGPRNISINEHRYDAQLKCIGFGHRV